MIHPRLKQQLAQLGITDPTSAPDPATWRQLLAEASASYAGTEGEQQNPTPAPDADSAHEQPEQITIDRIAEERENLRVFVESQGGGLGYLDLQGYFISMGQVGTDLLGFSAEELRSLNLADILVGDPHNIDRYAHLKQAIATGENFLDRDAFFFRQNGERMAVRITLNPITENGKLAGSMLVFFDVRDRREIEKRLQSSLNEALLINRIIAAAAAEFEPNAMLSAICKELSLAFNIPQAAVALLAEDETYLTVVAEHQTQDRPSAIGEIIPVEGNSVTQTVLETRRSVAIDNARTDPRQEILHDLYERRGTVSLLIVPLLIRGQVVGTIGFDALAGRVFKPDEIELAERVATAISQALENARLYVAAQAELARRKLMQEALQEARDGAMSASKAKSAFLAMMTHEIRTPMNIMLGMSELLAETELGAEQTQYVSTLQKAADALLVLINDVLDLSKIEAGHLGLERIDFDLGDLVERTVELFAPSAQAKGLEIVYWIDQSLAGTRSGDPGRLRQVLVNLIGNSIKFTGQGEVVLRVERADEPEADGVRFSVRDTGPGVPADRIDAIFQSFTQGDSSVTRKYGGTGLGLSISSSLVELMGGVLALKSVIGVGSEFYFTVPLPGDSASPATTINPIKRQPLRALVIDDNTAARDVAADLLREQDVAVIAVASISAALDQLQQAQAPFDLALLDLHMNDSEQATLAAELKRQSGNAPALIMLVPLIKRPEHSKRCDELGAADCLAKPLRRADLRAILAKHSKQQQAAPERAAIASGAPQAKGKLNILLVEDSPDNRLLIQTHLRKAGHNVECVENGELAVASFTGAAYDLVLMDVQMPVMDGYTATKHIRDWERQQQRQPTPIIALTAHALQDDIDKSLAAGCNSHVTKPISKARLLEVVAEYAHGVAPNASNLVALR